MTKTERWLNLLAFLLDRRYPVAREDLLSQVQDYCDDWTSEDDTRRESARRKFERDKSELRVLGVELETKPVWAEHTDQLVEGYQLRARDFYLPYLEVRTGKSPRGARPYALNAVNLTASELSVLRRAAQRVAQMADTSVGVVGQSALRKLAFDQPSLSVSSGEHRVVGAVPPHFDKTFRSLFECVRAHRAVRCRYYAIGRDNEESRTIEPYGLILSWGSWYCVAYSRERSAMRIFRVDRMRDVEVLTGKSAVFQVPKGFSVDRYLKRSPWELTDGKPMTVQIEVAFPQSRWVIGEGLGKVERPVTDDGGTVLSFEVRSLDPFLRWLLTLGSQVRVIKPASVARKLSELRSRIAARYA